MDVNRDIYPWNHTEEVVGRLETPCWEWDGYRLPNGYGRTGRRQIVLGEARMYPYAHRVSWALATGEWPGDLKVRHKCDNPPCINPSHLEAGTQAENMQDRDERGRGRYGPNAPRPVDYSHTAQQVPSEAQHALDARYIVLHRPPNRHQIGTTVDWQDEKWRGWLRLARQPATLERDREGCRDERCWWHL